MYHSKKWWSKIITRQIMNIFGLEIWTYTYPEFLKEITEIFHDDNSSKKGKSIFTPNPEICLKILDDREYLEILQSADYLTSDGIGLYLAYQIEDFPKILSFLLFPYFLFNILFRKKYLYRKYGERICGSDITSSLLEYAQHQNIRVSIIDPLCPEDRQKCESQETFHDMLSVKFPRLIFDFYVYSQENKQKIFEEIWVSESKILFSTLGMKKQEISVLEGLEQCPNLKLWLWVGSSFDYHIWFQKRAPKLFRDLWFEWLYRIFTSPNKLKRLGRIYQALIVFPIKVILINTNEKNT